MHNSFAFYTPLQKLFFEKKYELVGTNYKSDCFTSGFAQNYVFIIFLAIDITTVRYFKHKLQRIFKKKSLKSNLYNFYYRQSKTSLREIIESLGPKFI